MLVRYYVKTTTNAKEKSGRCKGAKKRVICAAIELDLQCALLLLHICAFRSRHLYEVRDKDIAAYDLSPPYDMSLTLTGRKYTAAIAAGAN